MGRGLRPFARHCFFALPADAADSYDIIAQPKNENENIVLNLPVPEAILEGIRQIEDQPFIESRFSENMVLFSGSGQNHFRRS